MFGGWLAEFPQRDQLWEMSAGLVSHAEGDNVAAVAALESFLDAPDPRLYTPLIGSMRLVLASARLATIGAPSRHIGGHSRTIEGEWLPGVKLRGALGAKV